MIDMHPFARRAHVARALAAAAVTSLLALAPACSSSDAAGTAAPVDAGSTDTPRESVPCKTGERTLPISAFDATPDPADTVGPACDVGNVLDEDGTFAGLDRAGDGQATIAGRTVNGCVGVEFGDAVVLASVIVKMRPVASACGHPCDGAGCGSGGSVAIFVGATPSKLSFLTNVPTTTTDLRDYQVAVSKTSKARYAVVCREAANTAAQDDVAVDSIVGNCY